ncbi:carbohydrate-binding module family 1 protein [Patellaria atrata CBS 101060]|uniref:Carbohydrate-binding module family 1 protein n=1 Tax=Patellaria atrata CBS 101060 TaxID=1346257 RepID=A0A9P4SEK3_9PEZI|nr:carbohydrate-binding module family 1 protein [Patellaria atrata CBS 101060]
MCRSKFDLKFLINAVIGAQAQDTFIDPQTDIVFQRYSVADGQTTGGFQFGYVLPTTSSTWDEYIGYMVGSRINGQGFTGFSHGGGMPASLLLVAWVDGEQVRTSFRWAGGYTEPEIYTGNATLTQIAHSINETHFTLTYRCQWCWYWNQEGAEGQNPPNSDFQLLGWAQADRSPNPPTSNEGSVIQHNNGFGLFGANPENARNSAYSSWAASATAEPTATATVTSTTSAVPTCTATTAPTETYDYIVVGAGAGGIPIADKLSEAGKKVLLLERGPTSSGRWGGEVRENWRPDWLDGTNLTRFDVPGLCNQIWVDSAGIACSDIDQMAGCVLGGGTAVNAALWWKPPAIDWDYNFPAGWKAKDLAAAVSRTFQRIPGTDHPSKDGKLYYQEGFNVLSTALSRAGWKSVTANKQPDLKNKTYSLTPYMFENGERGGPLATYLVTASKRSNFKLMTNASVRRIVRKGGHATGVELEGGNCYTINLTPNTGRVILSAGTFGSTKILFRSGIGPEDQLKVVAGSATDGASFINSTEWIKTPVGMNLNDHVNTDMIVSHPNVTFYDFYEAWTDPIPEDKDRYLANRTGILTQAAPNIGPVFWEEISGSDGVTRQLQYTARVEGPDSLDPHYMTISQYLGRGSTSRGRLTITPRLSMVVSDAPYLKTAGDKAAVIQGVANIQAALSKFPNLTFVYPAPNQTAEAYVNSIEVSSAKRRSNHWIGTSKIGTDSGVKGGTAVLDLNAQVYGTDNIHVVDASIFPGHVATNPSSLIVAAAEHAAARILALPKLRPQDKFSQCGGLSYDGPRNCVEGSKCTYFHDWLSQVCNI